ncbi:MAG: 30S ribosomal protein S16 [Clostridia bacterium]|nr:30S ribosomal protein S16 [Clostridia bacterium]
MAVKMRLTRMGDKKSPFYRVVVIDSRKAQSGEYIDKIGYVDPLKTPAEINIDVEKAKAWIAKGVQPTETVKSYLVKAGVLEQSKKLSAPKTNDKKKKKS